MTATDNKYNGKIHTFVAEPFINEVWDDLSKDKDGTTPVTIGTDDWFPTALPALILRKPFFNRLGAGSNADMTVYFYKNDRVYINDLVVYCSFADGLVKTSDVVVTPVPFALPENGIPNYELANELKVRITNYILRTNDDIESTATFDFPVTHFNQVNQLATFMPFLQTEILQTDKCQWYEIELIDDTVPPSLLPSYSTININPDFQNTRVLVWAEATLSHTFGTVDADAVTNDNTGWPD